MCGIWGIISKDKPSIVDKKYSKNVSHRGPDQHKYIDVNVGEYYLSLCFHRLAIIDVSNGEQPFYYESGNRKIYLLCNGEIYNYKHLIEKYNLNTKSDCHVILDMYLKIGMLDTLQQLDGEFAFVLIDIQDDDIMVLTARDRFGIRPLFVSKKKDSFYFASELKALNQCGYQVEPRFIHIYEINNNNYHSLPYYKLSVDTHFDRKMYSQCQNLIEDNECIYRVVRDTLIKSVRDRLVSERPLGCLLSGGLDSSLIAGIASMILKEKNERLHTFSIGISDDSPDVQYARLVANHINSIHHEIIIPQQEWIDSLKSVIYQIETYDTTTVRASTGQYLIGKWISENTDIKVILNGDGSDELCSGYMYFYNAPNAHESHNENIRLLNEIHFYDVLRVDRGISAWGLEARVPFLSHHFVDMYLSIDENLRHPIKNQRIEKYLLRKSFEPLNIIPNDVLWRKKEAFSDGVSNIKKSWYQIIEEQVSDCDNYTPISNYLVPKSKETSFYRQIFDEFYPHQEKVLDTNHYWLPKWSGNVINPSARVLDVYNN